MMKNKKFNTYSSFTKSVDDDKGVITIEGWASKAYENGKPIVDRDLEHVEVATLDISNCKIMLANHDWDRPIGKLELSHRPEGVWVKSQIFRDMDSVTFSGVKNGVLDSFSIGFTVSDYEYINVDGEDILQLKNGAIHEVSIVTIPANVKATIESVKSIMKGNQDVGLHCSVEHIKSMNPDFNCECEKGNMKKSIQEIIKGLTFEDTANETWNQYQVLAHYMKILNETIEDNFFESLWSDTMTGEEAKANILDTIQTFVEKLDEIEILKNPAVGVEKGKQEEMIIKSKEAEEVVETPAEEGQEVSTEEVVEEATETTEEESGKDTSNSESPEDTEMSDEENEQAQESTEVEDDGAEEVVEEAIRLVGNAQTTIGYLSTVTVEELSAEEIEALYDTADSIMEKIELYVREDLSGDED